MPGQSLVGVNEIRDILIQKNCNERLLQQEWITNHYRWIVLKAASMSRRFPIYSQHYWNQDYIISQLKTRFDKEGRF